MFRKFQILVGLVALVSVAPASYFFVLADTALQKYVGHAMDCEQRYGEGAPSQQAEPRRFERYFYTCDTSHRGSQISRLTRERDAYAHKARLMASVSAGLMTLVLALFMVAWFIGGQRAARQSRPE